MPGTEWLKFGAPESQQNQQHEKNRAVNSIVALPGGLPDTGLELGRSWHFFCVFFWVLNGFVYVSLLFITGEWSRLIPTSASVFPGALETFLQYASFHLPQSESLGHYNPLQQLTYAVVVFVFAPLSILTGAAISPALASRYPWYPRLFGGRQAARSIHFLLLGAYLIFLVVHVSLIALSNFPLHMNRIVLGVSSTASSGAVIGGAALLSILAINWWVTSFSIHHPDKVEAIVGFIKKRIDATLKQSDQENDSEETISLRNCADDELRDKIGKMMEDGLTTQLGPFPEDHQQFEAILTELRALEPDDVVGRLVISGFAPKPIDDQRCYECMYYLVHRKWCDLPELALPVEPEWWCRLWRI